MWRNRKSGSKKPLICFVQLVSFAFAAGQTMVYADSPPERCIGYGNVEVIFLQNWEAGLGSWTASTHSVANPATFSTPDWAVVGSLPGSRPGLAAFVADLDSDCAVDGSGVLRLNSPTITIPSGAPVPRISINHFFDTELGWDGGNLRISVNGGGFNLVPSSAVEFNYFNDTLFPTLDNEGFEYNTNPLADQPAYTGTIDGQPDGSWVETRINLLGIADAGDSVRLRFDFGVDTCLGEVGWYVDEVEVYNCEAELAPSDCGNGVIDSGEQCDDGNNFIGDGCSNVCQIDEGWQCSAPTPAGVIPDYSFEDGRNNQYWTEVSNNTLGSPICDVATCNTGGGSGASDGTYWVWIGGSRSYREESVSQSVVIPSTVSELTFDLEIPACDSASDYFEVLIDGNQELLINGSSPFCGIDGYSSQSVDISAYANDSSHNLAFHGETISANGGISNFFIDNVALPLTPSICRREGTNLTLIKTVTNDDGGTAQPLAWTLTASGPSSFSGQGPIVLSEEGFLPGTYNLSESGPAGYSASEWVCDGGTQDDADTITLAQDDSVTCTISNDDIAPTLKVVKTVVNNNGGTITNKNAFGLRIDGGSVLHNVTNAVDVGPHTVSEDGLPGYQAGSWGGDCALDGSVTLALGQAATCTITNDDISPTLTVQKTIINDNGGTVNNQNAFGLKVDGGSVLHNASNEFDAGSHMVSETGLSGYQAGVWGGDCAPDGSITLALDQDATCTITNDDISPTLKLVKTIFNDNGGTVTDPNAFGLQVDGQSVLHDAVNSVDAGGHNVSEVGLPGYQPGIWGGDCNPDGSINLSLGQNATCTISNDDTNNTSLTLVKQLTNNSGGEASASSWTLTATGPTGFSGPGPNVSNGPDFAAGTYDLSESTAITGYATSGAWVCVGGTQIDGDSINLGLGQAATCTIGSDDIPARLVVQKTINNDDGGTVNDPNLFGLRVDNLGVLHNATNEIDAGDHMVSEDGLPAYQAGAWGGDCATDGSITLALDQDATCTITNDDIPPTLKIINTIINDNGGGITDENAFGLRVDDAIVLHNVANVYAIGSHVVSEVGLSGYQAGTWGGDCDALGNVNLSIGQTATCTITNNDISPTLKVIKNITNDNGGQINNPNAFGLQVDGGSVLHDTVYAVDAGSHTVSEVGLAGYQPSVWGGDCNPDGTITLALGQNAICSITNDDTDSTSLTLVKQVISDNGGLATASSWHLTATGPTTFDGPGPNVPSPPGFVAGSYDLSESGGTSGYDTNSWVCVGGSQVDGDTISLAFNDSATCTITSNDISPTLTVNKTILNEDGGSVTDPNAFGLRIDGLNVLHGAGNEVNAGPRVVSEDGLEGYLPGTWGGDCASDGSITLALAENKICTITNDDISPTLKVVNNIVNDNNGPETDPNAFLLKVDGGGVTDNASNEFAAGPHTVSQVDQPGYQPGAWGGDCNPDGTITLVLGQDAVCSITNNDIQPTLKVVKSITNDNGGTVTNPNAFNLRVGSDIVLHNAINGFDAGTYTASEDGLANYDAGEWGGDCATNGSITLAIGQEAICTINNDDTDTTSLTLKKTVINDNGGNRPASAWTLYADGPTPFSGAGPSVSNDDNFSAGIYNLSESSRSNYSASDWVCVGGTQLDGDTIKLTLGESATCTITNDDIAPTLTIENTITNDNGGTINNPNSFNLKVDGEIVLSHATNSFDVGVHTVSEETQPGYEASDWGGDCAADGSITLALGDNATCTITNNDISPTLTVQKTIVNDHDGTITDEDAFKLRVDGNIVLHDQLNFFNAGNHTVSEDGLADYQPGPWGGDCDPGGNITLALGQNATCTITNDDIDSNTTSLTLIKQVINDDGGDASGSDWVLTATGPSTFSGSGPNVSSAAGFLPGTYDLSESSLPGYDSDGIWNCVGGTKDDDDTITLAANEAAICTITNDDISPTLKVIKTVITDSGGTVRAPDEFFLRVDGVQVFDNAINDFDAGYHNVSEDGLAGYQPGLWGGDCEPDGNIILALGQNATCTITNDDIDIDTTSLTLIKQVINDNGGDASGSDWTLTATGPSTFSGSGPNVSSAAGFLPGTYDLSESTVISGYDSDLVWVCVGVTPDDDDTITLTANQSVICTITSDDISPTLTVLKTIDNNFNGPEDDPDAFFLRVDGGSVLHNETNNFDAGDHVVSEDGLAGYLPGDWGGDCAADGSITLALDQDATCSITNNDISPTITVINNVIANNGGTVTDPDAFFLKVDGGDVLDGDTNNFNVGSHTVSQTNVSGYQAGPWGGDCAPDGSIILALGDDAICTITNDDISPTLTVVKTVENNSGGQITDPNAFGLRVGGVFVLDSVTNDFNAGTYTVSEIGQSGYAAGDWGGDCATDGTITLSLAQNATCSITNDDISPTLRVVNNVINDDGGGAAPDDFALQVDAGGVLDGAVNAINAGAHTVSQANQAGYQAGTWGGDCAPDGSITLALDEDATCTITNDDIAPTLVVEKIIVSDNGGTIIEPNAFGLRIDGDSVLHNAVNTLTAGAHIVSEDGQPGYEGTIGGACAGNGSITLALDQHLTCTITNDDVDTTSLSLVKVVTNDNGGEAQPIDWTLTATGNRTFSGPGTGVSSGSNFSAGTYVLSENTAESGYDTSNWVCVGGTQLNGDSISLALGESATCTSTSNDIAPTLTVEKTIITDSGGTQSNPNAFGLRVDNNIVLHGVTNSFDAGDHLVSEDGLDGYQGSSWGGNCSGDGSITLALAQNATCTITNNDISPTITVINTIITDNGGTESDPDVFGLKVGTVSVSDSVANSFDAGTHIVSQAGLNGYAASVWGGDCAPDGSITLSLDEDATCTITNDDISPTITVMKTITNDNGGLVLDRNAFGLRVNGALVLDSAINNFDAGVEHTVSEDGLPFYAAGDWGGDCAADGKITLSLGQNASCNITNDDTDETGLMLVKQLSNDNGGVAVPGDWTLTASGPTGFSGSGAGVSNGANFSAGIYDLSESTAVSGYSTSAWVCEGGAQLDDDTISLALGETATCTISGDDISPTLKVVKNITNNNGGTVNNPNAFGLRVDGGRVLNNAVNQFDAGGHTVSEDGLDGYQAGSWSGDCASNGSINLALAQNAVCTITNNDISPTITVINQVISDDGGTSNDPDAFGLMVDGGVVSDSLPNNFDAGTHTVSLTGVTGYQSSVWGGDCAPDGSITLALEQDAICTITNDDISPTIKVVKTITNDNGGTILDPNAFGLRVDGNLVLDSAVIAFKAGVEHTVSEDGLPFYEAGDWGGDCASDGTITLALDQDATCSLTNNDTDETRLTLVKQVINDNGGGAVASNWTLTATGPKTFSGSGSGVSSGAGFIAGVYDLSESPGPAGYSASNWVCMGGTQLDGDTISLALGQVATCTTTSDDITPTIRVQKTVINNNGGTVTNRNAFGLRVDGGAVLHNVTNAYDAGAHVVSEDGLDGYQEGSWGGACAANGSITLALAQTATCTIINNDISPTITVINTVVNDNGGTRNDPDDFRLMVDGEGVSDSVPANFDAGTHMVSLVGLSGYQAGSWGGDCAADGSVTLELDEDAICTITNDDISPTLKVVKTVINDSGGSVTDPNVFGLKVDGNNVQHNVFNSFNAGSHTVSETGLAGYQPGNWGGDCAPDGSITLKLAEVATCTIINNDIAPTLRVVKTVVNDNGGTITNRNSFKLRVDGNIVSHNVTNSFDAGNHVVSEDGLPGYQAGDWGGDCNPNGSITLVLGQVATCTITNDDIPPQLTVINTVVHDDGGTVTDPNAFGLKVDGSVVQNNETIELNVGSHTVSQTGVTGYQASTWGGDCASDGSITLALNQVKTCTITNDDISPTLKVVKTVINDNGGVITDKNAFGLKVDGAPVLHNAINKFKAGFRVVSEDGLPGYVAGDWGGDCNPDGSIRLELDQDATCTITNNDTDSTSLTLVKQVTNDNGGTALASAWTLTATGPTGFSGSGPNVSNGPNFAAGSYDLSESGGPAGYTSSIWVCNGGAQDDADTIMLELGEAAICTITSNDISPTLKVVKKIINDNGGTITNRNAFGLKVDGSTVLHNAINDFDAGGHIVSEDGLPGYVPGSWGGDCAPDGSITLALAQDATCTITNDDSDSTSLTLIKKVVNNGSGTASASAWALSASGPSGFSGKGPTVSSAEGFIAGTYNLSESAGQAGYTASDWVCSGATQDDGDTITLKLGENATCTITNTDTNIEEVIFENGFETK